MTNPPLSPSTTDSNRVDLRRYVRVARRSLWMIIACPVIAALVAGGVSTQLAPVYEAHVSLLVRPAQVLPAGAADANSVAITSDQISRTYAQLITQRPLLDKVIGELSLNMTADDLSKKIKITPQPNTTILDVAVDDTSPTRASTIANVLTNDFISQIKQIQASETASQSTRPEDNLVMVSSAVPPDKPISPKIPLNVAIAFAAGLLLALGAVLLREYVDQTVKSDDELTERTGLVPIAHIPFVPVGQGRRAELLMLNPGTPVSEAYRHLRTNLLFSTVDRKSKLIVVTSAAPGEGKSRTASNLAAALAQAGYSTLLIDADFRRPSLHRILGRVRNVGMSNLTIQDVPEEELITQVEGLPALAFIASGPTPPNPSELLGSARMRTLLQRFRERYNYVIIDTPPVNAVTDASVLAASADGVLIVAESRRSTYPALIHARDSILRVGGHIIGAVVNKMRTDGADAYYGAYEYGAYGDAARDKNRPQPAAAAANGSANGAANGSTTVTPTAVERLR